MPCEQSIPSNSAAYSGKPIISSLSQSEPGLYPTLPGQMFLFQPGMH
jgi:hypothetical protein